MLAEELILIDSRKVRGSSNLMAIYIEAFTNHFGYAPNCAGCTFNRDFKKLKAAIRQSKPETKNTFAMENSETTFKLKKKSGSILTYKKDKKPYRIYDHRMTEAFAVAFLTTGTKQEIESRKKLFDVLPEAVRPKEKKVKEPVTLEETISDEAPATEVKPKAKKKNKKQPEDKE